MKLSRFLAPVFLLVLLSSGCAIHPEGIGIHNIPNEKKYDKLRTQLIQNREDAQVSQNSLENDMSPGVVVVGRVGPFRDFSNSRTFKSAYDDYVKYMISIGEAEKMLTREELKEIASGWTTITFDGIPQIAFSMVHALVSIQDTERIGFSSIPGTILFGAREDLVAAYSSIEFPYYIITNLLCKDGKGYSKCTRKYKSGRYDVYTGRELNRDYMIKEDGIVISTETYEVIAPIDD